MILLFKLSRCIQGHFLSCNHSKILYLYEVSCMPSINLNCINSFLMVISPVPRFSNSQNLEASHNLCTYCIIDSFGTCLLMRNFVLSTITNFFFGGKFLFIMSKIFEKVKSSNSLRYTMTDLMASHPTKPKEICNNCAFVVFEIGPFISSKTVKLCFHKVQLIQQCQKSYWQHHSLWCLLHCGIEVLHLLSDGQVHLPCVNIS